MKLLSCLLVICGVAICVYTQREICRIDLAIVVDRSGSIWVDQPNQAEGRANWIAVKTFVADIIRRLTVGDDDAYVALVAFENTAEIVFNLRGTDKNGMIREANDLFYDQNGGVTRTDLALQEVLDNVFNGRGNDRRDATNVIFMITDGRVNPEEYIDDTNRLATRMKNNGVIITAVGVTDQVDTDELNAIASGEDYVTYVGNFNELQQILDEIVERTCQQTNPTPPPPSECPPINQYALAFSAYASNTQMMQFVVNMTIPFSRTYVNVGNGFNTGTSRFTCQCPGLYQFHLTMSYVTSGLALAIMRDNEVVAPLAFVTPNGAMSTTTIIRCEEGQQVYVRVMATPDLSLMACTFNGYPLYGFTGEFLYNYRR